MAKVHLDVSRLKVALQQLDREQLLVRLERAVDLFPRSRRAELAEGLLDPVKRPARGEKRVSVAAEVEAFHQAVLAEEFYESFRVDSKNFSTKSPGTRRCLAEFHRLLDSCVAAAATGPSAELRQAFESLFDVLRRVDRGEDVVFFADEGGAWQFGVRWKGVLPGYLRCLAATTGPQEYASAVLALVHDFTLSEADRWLPEARQAASTAQRKALDERTKRAVKTRA